MSGLSKPPKVAPVEIDSINAIGVLVDPTVELTQPGGPAPVGHGILADGLGGYTIAMTLRPYFLGFKLPTQVTSADSVFCEHHGVATNLAGVVIPFTTNLIAISVSVNEEVAADTSYNIEILSNPTGEAVVIATLSLTTGNRTDFRRDLSIEITDGTEIGVRFSQTAGAAESLFNIGIVNVELET